MPYSMGQNFTDLNLGVVLAMALTLLVVLASAHFENRHFVVTALGDDGSVD